MIGAASYEKVDDAGLHISSNGKARLLEVDNVIICAGQVPLRTLYDELQSSGLTTHLIGGADEAKELDAKRAIDQGYRLALLI